MLLFIQVALLVTDVLSITPILGFDAVSLSVVLILQFPWADKSTSWPCACTARGWDVVEMLSDLHSASSSEYAELTEGSLNDAA